MSLNELCNYCEQEASNYYWVVLLKKSHKGMAIRAFCFDCLLKTEQSKKIIVTEPVEEQCKKKKQQEQ